MDRFLHYMLAFVGSCTNFHAAHRLNGWSLAFRRRYRAASRLKPTLQHLTPAPLATVGILCMVTSNVGVSIAETPTLPVPDGFLQGSKWGPDEFGTAAMVTWSYETIGSNQTDLADFMPTGFNSEIEAAFQAWSDVADINFQQVSSGGDISLYGQSIDGPGGVAGTASFPNHPVNRIRFDTDNSWSVDGSAGTDVRRLAVHEIGHAIGLLHPPGVIARMNHSVSSAYEGLLPNDVAGVQAIYGPAAGFDVNDYVPTNVVSFDVLPTSEITVTASIAGLLEIAGTTEFFGSLESQVQWDGNGQPSAIAFHKAALDFGSLTAEQQTSLFDVLLQFNDVQGDLFSDDWFGLQGQLTSINDGSFDATNLVLGLVGGDLDYAVLSETLDIDATGNFNFNFVNTTGAGPQAFGAEDFGQQGTISQTDWLIALEIPLNMQTTVSVPVGSANLPVEFEIIGTIHAHAIVPEPSVLTSGLMLILGLTSRPPRRRREATVAMA